MAGALTAMVGALSPLSATVAPSTASGTGAASPVVSSSVTATAAGGTGSYTYAWEIDEPLIVINSPTAATTTFQKVGGTLGTFLGNATCVVSSGGQNAYATPVVVVTLTRT